MATTPAFAATPRAAIAQVTTANTNRDGSGTPVALFTPGANGSKIEEIVVEAIATTTAGMVRIFLSPDGGTTYRLIDEFAVTAITPSGTVSPFRASRKYANLVVPVGYKVAATTHNTETFNVFALGGDF